MNLETSRPINLLIKGTNFSYDFQKMKRSVFLFVDDTSCLSFLVFGC